MSQVRSISGDDDAAENSWWTGDESLDDGHDWDDEMDGSEGDLEGALAGTVLLYIVTEAQRRERKTDE